MAEVVVLRNPLDVSRRARCHLAEGVALLAWVDEHEPSPVAAAAVARAVFVNGALCSDRDYRTRAHDEILVTFAPCAELTLAQVGLYVLQALVGAAIGFVLGKLFAPKQPAAGASPNPSQVYGIAPPRNAARLGQPIPVIYGAVVALPDFASQPYTRFTQANDQMLYALLCLGEGEHDVTEMMFGPTTATGLGPDALQWRVFQPADHGGVFGRIQGTITGFAEDMVTSPAVGDQELVAPNMGGVLVPSTWYWAVSGTYTSPSPAGLDLSNASSPATKLALLPASPTLGTAVLVHGPSNGSVYTMWTYTATAVVANQNPPANALVPPPTWSGAGADKYIGPFVTCKGGKRGALLELDFVFPGGLYVADASGNLADRTVAVQVEYRALDSQGNVIAPGTWTTYTETFTAHDNTPQRFTRPRTVVSARYQVRVKRTTNGDGKVTTADRVIWAGLKHQLDAPVQGMPAYGNVTLIAVSLKATNGVAADAAGSMRFRCKRRLRPLGDPNQASAATANPADAFVDIMIADYGGARPRTLDELDLDELGTSRTAWASHNGFNAVFDQPSTVWEALTLSVQTVHAAPLPVGSRMSLIHDQVQPVRTQLFTDANVVAGSLQVAQAFDATGTPTGVRVNYRDPVSFAAAALQQPAGAPDYVAVDLFGCTDQAVAQEHANLLQAKRSKQRSSITFSTELEGLNVLPGDRIGVQAGMVKWAQAARVAAVAADGRTLTLDRPLTWKAGAAHAVQLRDDAGAPQRVTGVTRGVDDAHLVLPSAPPITLYGAGADREPTHLAFGVQDQEITDWTVAKITPDATTVSVEAMNYDASIYAGAAAFTRGEVPDIEETAA
jgi:hypothetical protein